MNKPHSLYGWQIADEVQLFVNNTSEIQFVPVSALEAKDEEIERLNECLNIMGDVKLLDLKREEILAKQSALLDECERALEKCKERLVFISSKSCADHEMAGVGWWESDTSIGCANEALTKLKEFKEGR